MAFISDEDIMAVIEGLIVQVVVNFDICLILLDLGHRGC
jgi:hypothetical protein